MKSIFNSNVFSGKSDKRMFILTAIIVFLFLILVMQLVNLTIVQGTSYSEKSKNTSIRTITVSGSRGSILDSSGIVLAYDEKSYDVVFKKDQTKTSSDDRAYYTGILMKTIDIIEENSGTIENEFSIKRDDNGDFYFDFNTTDETVFEKRLSSWKTNMYLTGMDDAEEIYNQLRLRYQIPDELSYDDAVKLLSIWQQLQLNNSSGYLSITIAKDVNINTVSELKARSEELEGVDISEGTVRVYPKQSTAAHIIGYMGKMQDNDTIAEMQALGYSSDDLIGIAGIESTMESVLTANTIERQGKQEVSKQFSQIIRTLSTSSAKSGNNVVLTIDLGLQEALEESLENNIAEIYKKQQEEYTANKSDYEDQMLEDGRTDEIKFATTGAAVVIDINSGKVLAMASYPSFDLNLFTNGISEVDYEALTDEDTTPLFNKAVSSKGTPGSIFKMVTATAGLMEYDTTGITVNTTISDGGYFTAVLGEDADTATEEEIKSCPSCWVRPNFSKHKDQNVVLAIKNSCNYYFFTVAYRLGISNLTKWADNFGLTEKTGIQLPAEAVGQVGGQEVLYDNTKDASNQKTAIPILVKRLLISELKNFGQERSVEYTDEELDNAAEALLKLASNDEEEMGPKIRTILSENLGISKTISSSKGWDKTVASILTELMWNPTRTILTGIGQGVAAVTPVGVSRYVAAILNGGTVYDLSIVDKIASSSGTVLEEIEPSVYKQLDIPEEYLAAIKEGMREVVSEEDQGTASSYFKNYKYIDEIGGKTGTAQVSNIDIENNSWFVGFTPYENPEIVVVVYVPHGLSGGLSSLVAKDVFTYYLDEKARTAEVDIPDSNTLVGDS
ncbi:MAG: penicillin-binding transpeptidase domain-containing protein [Eubacteriales bacterium]